MRTIFVLALITLAACSPEVAGPSRSANHIPPIPPDEPLDDLLFPYSLYDADGHLYSALTGTDSAGAWSLHLRDAAPFARIRDAGGPMLEIDLFANGDGAARLSIRREAAVIGLACPVAEAAYLRAASTLLTSTNLLTLLTSHVNRRRAALAARAFSASWRAREACTPTD